VFKFVTWLKPNKTAACGSAELKSSLTAPGKSLLVIKVELLAAQEVNKIL
jgi:hypothetical protein